MADVQTREVRVAAVQMAAVFADVPANLEKAGQLVGVRAFEGVR